MAGFTDAKIGGMGQERQPAAGNPMYYSELPEYITAGMGGAPRQQVVNGPSFNPVAAAQIQRPAAVMDAPSVESLPYAQRVAYNQAQAVGGTSAMPMSTETQVQQKIIDPKLQAKEEAANLQMIGAQRAQLQADEEASRIRAIGYDKLSREMEMKQAEFNKVMEEFKGAKVVDPQEKWGTAGKIGAAISMALGAFAATYSGGRNYAADIIDGAIKRDVDMQEAAIRKLGLDAQGAQNALATAYRKLGDMAQARNAVEMAAIANVGEDIMKRAEKSDNDKVKANAQATLAALNQATARRASAQNEITIATAGKPMTRGATMELETPYGMAPSVTAANVVREKAMGLQESKMGLADAKEYISKHGSFEVMPGASKGEYESVLVGVKSTYQKLMNLGVLNPSEDEKMDKLVRNKLSRDEALAFIGGLDKKLANQEQALQRAYIVSGGLKAQGKDDVAQQKARVEYTK